MSGYDSSSFKKQPSNPSVTRRHMREFNVGFPEDMQGVPGNPEFVPQQVNAPIPQRPGPEPMGAPRELQTAVREAKREQMADAKRVTSGAKQRIELLVGIGRLKKDVKIGDYNFSIRTLKSKEIREAAIAVFSENRTQLEAGYEARRQQLARSIYAIDGQPVELVLGTDSFEYKLEFIDELEDVVVEKLWDELNILKEKSRTDYGINSVKEAEEVSEDLKK